jgi:hypothetical protein
MRYGGSFLLGLVALLAILGILGIVQFEPTIVFGMIAVVAVVVAIDPFWTRP